MNKIKLKKVLLKIGGMTCSACSSGLEKYLNKQDVINLASVNLVMNDANIEYVEKDIENVEIVIKHSDYCSIDNINVENDTIDIWRYLNQDKAFDAIRQTIKDINNKKINDYSQIKVYVYASQENINKLKVNTENKRKQAMENEISYLEDKIDSLEIQIESLEEEIYEKDIIIDDLRNEY